MNFSKKIIITFVSILLLLFIFFLLQDNHFFSKKIRTEETIENREKISTEQKKVEEQRDEEQITYSIFNPKTGEYEHDVEKYFCEGIEDVESKRICGLFSQAGFFIKAQGGVDGCQQLKDDTAKTICLAMFRNKKQSSDFLDVLLGPRENCQLLNSREKEICFEIHDHIANIFRSYEE